ncbi:hypothetical protein D3C83_172930 [compost metagenome]
MISSEMPVRRKEMLVVTAPPEMYAVWIGTSSPALMTAFTPCVARMFGSPRISALPLLLSSRIASLSVP